MRLRVIKMREWQQKGYLILLEIRGRFHFLFFLLQNTCFLI